MILPQLVSRAADVLSRPFRIAKATTAPMQPATGLMLGNTKPTPFVSMGASGLLRTKGPLGYVYEEWLPQLAGQEGRRAYREMWDNDAVLGAVAFKLQMILRRAIWRIEPAEGTGSKGQEIADFVWSCTEDMTHAWGDVWAEYTQMFPFGFAVFETTYKRRQGPQPGKKPSSKFDDGLIGWKDWAPRSQESIYWWDWDEETGELSAAIQLSPPDYKTVRLPMEQLVHFTTTSNKRNPEGRSVLRNSYVSYIRKKRLEEIEGIGAERDACGYPVLYISAEALSAWGSGDQEAGKRLAEEMIKGVRVDDQMGAILPVAYDDKGNPLVKLELLKGAGAKQIDIGPIIRRHNQDMLNTMLCGFLQLGQTEHGARNLHQSAGADFAQAVAAYLESACGTINRTAIPRLLQMNSMDLALCPALKLGELGVKDLEELGTYVRNLAAAGIPLADPETEKYLRKTAGLPEQSLDLGGNPLVPPTEKPASPQPKPPAAPVEESNPEGADRLEEAAA